jgi:hemerythrin superfamily protein
VRARRGLGRWLRSTFPFGARVSSLYWRGENVNAIQMLEKQHREVEDLFGKYDAAGDGAKKTKERILRRIADAVALHSELEEKIFYPESKASETEELLREAVEEHLSVKRVIADLLESDPEDEQLDARMNVLKEQIEHHVEEEEGRLFPQVKKVHSKQELEEQGERMQQLAKEIEARGEPSKAIPGQTDAPSHI